MSVFGKPSASARVKAIVLIFCLLLWALWFFVIRDLFVPDKQELHRLQTEGDKIVAQIKQYNTKNGRYPSDLENAEIHVPRERYGGWKYLVPTDHGGTSCELCIGDYRKNGFTYFWDSKANHWCLDQ
jgi:hypothetical protein